MAVTGLCQLCGTTGPLVDSHVVPQSFWKGITSGGETKIYSNTPGEFPKQSRTGIYDQFVCLACEASFGDYDAYAKELLLDGRPNANQLGASGKLYWEFPAFNYHKLKLFFMITLWRAHCSTQTFYEKVDLGSAAKVLAELIKSKNPGLPDEFATVLAAFDAAKTPSELHLAPLDPHPEQFDGVNVFRFYLGGYIAYIKVDDQLLPSFMRPLQLDSSNPLRVVERDPQKELALMSRIVQATEHAKKNRLREN